MECLTLRSLFDKTEEFADKKVTVGGWVRSNRDSKSFGFLVISDGTFFTERRRGRDRHRNAGPDAGSEAAL